MYYFCDKKTLKFLNSKKKRVFLYGSYDDPNNFGDIIQLKGALHQHKTKVPVIMLSYRAFKDDTYLDLLRQWFDCEHFVFIAGDKPVQEWSSLEQIENIPKGGLLHVYGGGYFNHMWGGWKIQQIESILDDFHIDDYLISGQQIDLEIVPGLERLFKKKMPVAIGLRDRQSLDYIRTMDIEIPAYYSFDDVTEIFIEWTRGALSLRQRVIPFFKNSAFAIHMNLASYTGDHDHYNDILNAIREIKHHYPSYRPAVLHSYNERRPEFTKDSLGTIIDLQEDFPYHAYGVTNLAQMALDMSPRTGYYPDIRGLLSSVSFGVTCSYHTSILLSFLGKPTYLIASNEYYVQKRKGLGYTDDLQSYIQNPSKYLRDFSEDVAARKEWNDHIKEYIG